MARAELEIRTEKVDDITLVKLAGPVDAATFDTYKEVLNQVCRAESSPRLVIDCSDLSYINSKGIGLLASLHRMVMIQMGHIALFGLSLRILKTLELLGLGKRLRIYNDRDEAIASFSLAGDKAAEA